MYVDIDVDGAESLELDLVAIQRNALSFEPALRMIGQDFESMMSRRFDTAGFGTWPPLAESTVRAKARAGLDPRILHATLALRNSLTQSGAEHSIRDVTADTAFFGTDVDYARFHQYGTRHMPQRQPVEIGEADRRRWVKVLQEWALRGTRNQAASPGGLL